MKTIRTSTRLTRHDGRRLRSAGFSIDYIETRQIPGGEESTIVWSRPYGADEIRDEELPY